MPVQERRRYAQRAISFVVSVTQICPARQMGQSEYLAMLAHWCGGINWNEERGFGRDAVLENKARRLDSRQKHSVSYTAVLLAQGIPLVKVGLDAIRLLRHKS